MTHRPPSHVISSGRRVTLLGAAAMFIAATAPSARAQAEWPAKPVKIVVAFAPGGPNDVMARILAAKLSVNLGQQFLVDNRPGAGGTIGTDAVAKSAGDGYTLLFNSAPFVTAPALYGSRLNFDTLKDITGITKVAESPLVFMVKQDSNFKTMQDVLTAAKAQPGKLNYGSGGIASTPHLATSLLQVQNGLQMQHIPYKGGGPALQALMGGEIDFLFDSITSGGTFVSSGKLRAIAVTGNKRTAKLPEVPTMAEAGLPAYKMVHWVGLAAPAKTPPALLERIHRETLRAMSADDVRARFAELGAEPAVGPSDQFNAFLKQEVEEWTRVVKQAGIKAE